MLKKCNFQYPVLSLVLGGKLLLYFIYLYSGGEGLRPENNIWRLICQCQGWREGQNRIILHQSQVNTESK